jgi:phenylacetate-CoA ligase
MPAIQEFRIVQETIDHLVLHLVLRQSIGPTEDASLRAQFAAVFGSDMRITIERTTSLPRTASGKFRYVESRVAQAVLERLMAPTHTKEHSRDDR